jgi:hypothetical protein
LEGTFCSHVQCKWDSSALKMEAAVLLEVLVKLYKITYFCTSEDCNLQYLVLGTALHVGETKAVQVTFPWIQYFGHCNAWFLFKTQYYDVFNVLSIILAFSTLVRYANSQKRYFMPLFK